jgi:hypothetical protein
MLEIALVVIAVVVAGLAGSLAAVFTPALVTVLGLGTLLLGLAVGVSTGFWYHVMLYRFVSAKVPLSRTWWLSPSTLHRHLTDAERRGITPWYRLGGVGFVLCVAGGLAAIAGALMTPR